MITNLLRTIESFPSHVSFLSNVEGLFWKTYLRCAGLFKVQINILTFLFQSPVDRFRKLHFTKVNSYFSQKYEFSLKLWIFFSNKKGLKLKMVLFLFYFLFICWENIQQAMVMALRLTDNSFPSLVAPVLVLLACRCRKDFRRFSFSWIFFIKKIN